VGQGCPKIFLNPDQDAYLKACQDSITRDSCTGDALVQFLQKGDPSSFSALTTSQENTEAIETSIKVNSDGYAQLMPTSSMDDFPALSYMLGKQIGDNSDWEPAKVDGKMVCSRIVVNLRISKDSQEEIYSEVDEEARFLSVNCEKKKEEKRGKCAKQAMLEFLYRNLSYPKKAREAKAEGINVVLVTIMKDGSIGSAEISRPLHPALDSSVLATIGQMSKSGMWVPTIKDGQKVNSTMYIPVRFKLQK